MFGFFKTKGKIKIIVEDKSKSINDKIIEIDNILSSVDIKKLSKSEKVFVFVENLEKELNNGGFNQFFFNSTGNYCNETLEALKIIKAEKTFKLLEEAINQFPNKKIPLDEDKRRNLIEKIEDKVEEKWNELDNFFYKYEDDIAKMLLNFVENNSEDFLH